MMSIAVPQYTQSGEAHGLINILTNSVENNDFKHMKPDVKTNLEKEKKEDSRIVKAEYLNSKGKHERLDKPYCRYAGDPIQIWHLIPGRVYELPMGFIKEVNGNKMQKRSGLLEVDGVNATQSGAPLDKDRIKNWEHRLIPCKY